MRRYGLLQLFLALLLVALVAGCRDASRETLTHTITPEPELPVQRGSGGLTFSAAGSIWQANADGSDISLLVRAGDLAPSLSSPTYSPDGRRMAYVSSTGAVFVADTESPANPTTTIDLFEDASVEGSASDWSMTPRAVHWSPDGEWLLVTRQRCCGSGAADVMLVRPDDSERRAIIDPSRLPSFPEATWAKSTAPGVPELTIVVVGGETGLAGTAYDLDGREKGVALPLRATRQGVVAIAKPAGEGALVASALGSPEPFGPIEMIDSAGMSRIMGSGCGAAWSPDGSAIAYYDGRGIVVQGLDAPPDGAKLIVRNRDLVIDDPDAVHEELCAGISITWRGRDPKTMRQEEFTGLSISAGVPREWTMNAAPIPYATCNDCTVIGPSQAQYPYGIQMWKGTHQVGCQLTCYLNIRALAQDPTRTIDANGHVALRQEFERQRPLGMVNEDGDTTPYREILMVLPLEPIEGLPPEAEVAAVFIDGFYRYGDDAGEQAVRAALAYFIDSLRIVTKPD